MQGIEKICLSSFRNYDFREFSFRPGINLIYGENGIGKSNLLEALLITSIGKSHRTKNLKEAINHDQEKFFININYKKEHFSQSISITYNKKSKEILHNKTKYSSFTKLLGQLPSILYSPSDVDIITGDPSHRRKFLDIHLAQTDPIYVSHLARYNKALTYRNALLKEQQMDNLDLWEEQLYISGSYIQEKRKAFIKELEDVFIEEFSHFEHKDCAPKVLYKPSPKESLTKTSYVESREKDRILGFTTIGPHRDNLSFALGEENASRFSSEGEKRLLVISLKLASYKMMNALIFAMDDFSSYLDKHKQNKLLQRLSDLPQVFLTAPADADFSTTSLNSIHLASKVLA